MENADEVIEKLAEVLGESGSTAVVHYSDWFVVNSLTWIMIGIILIVLSFLIKIPMTGDEYYDLDRRTGQAAARVLCWVIGSLMVGCNIPDLFAPEAASVHQLIQDIRG